MVADPKVAEAAPTSQDFPLHLNNGRGLTAKFEEYDCAVLTFNAPCLGLGLNDLLKASGQKIRTLIRHADPQTVKEWHRDEAIRVLKFFRATVLAKLRRDGSKWEWAKLSKEEVQERLAGCDQPLRDVSTERFTVLCGPVAALSGPSRPLCRPPAALHCGPVALRVGPATLRCGPAALRCGPAARHCGPAALRCGPAALHCGPVALRCGPATLSCGPVAALTCGPSPPSSAAPSPPSPAARRRPHLRLIAALTCGPDAALSFGPVATLTCSPSPPSVVLRYKLGRE
ncbi:unnamed protein product [Closterium sp. NIES-65]|nr:unnamed protein product [Closterium sp. NIES-65]CAI5970148.1 unnamed protein product [Closterium sp. NIES-65]